MRVTEARLEGDRLVLVTPDKKDALRFTYGFKAGDYELKRTPKKRSLDANAYAWVLIGKLSEALRIDATEIYRNACKEIGGAAETVCMVNEAVSQLVKGWEHNGLGWTAETVSSKLPGCTNVILHYGSSVYDTRQMSALIDHLVQDCQAVGIETRPAEEIASLLEAWK